MKKDAWLADKYWILPVVMLLVVGAYVKRDSISTAVSGPSNAPLKSGTLEGMDKSPDIDFRMVQERDAEYRATADKQSWSKRDTNITRRIRQALLRDTALSTEAQNVKVITQRGKVTLRGNVRSTNEEQLIVDKASLVVGANNVVEDINVVPSE